MLYFTSKIITIKFISKLSIIISGPATNYPHIHLRYRLSLRNISKTLQPFNDRRRYVSLVWNWKQSFGSCHIKSRK